jgi:hypothetical protein
LGLSQGQALILVLVLSFVLCVAIWVTVALLSVASGGELERTCQPIADLFPHMPCVADLPSGWRHFSTAEKIEHLIGLDRCYEILSWPSAGLDRVRLSMRVQAVRIILIIAGKGLLNGSLDRETARERERDRALARVMSELP